MGNKNGGEMNKEELRDKIAEYLVNYYDDDDDWLSVNPNKKESYLASADAILSLLPPPVETLNYGEIYKIIFKHHQPVNEREGIICKNRPDWEHRLACELSGKIEKKQEPSKEKTRRIEPLRQNGRQLTTFQYEGMDKINELVEAINRMGEGK